MSSPKRRKVVALLANHVNEICAISYVLGVLGFLALPFRGFSENHYHSENALLTGLQTPNFGANEARVANGLNELIRKTQSEGQTSDVTDLMIEIMEKSGISAYKQKFMIKSPIPKNQEKGSLQYQIRNGTNIYGLIRAGRAASTECIVLNVPILEGNHNYGIGLALSFGKQIRTQPFWAKDIVLLFTEIGYVGAQAWLQSYYDFKKSEFIQAEPLKERAGTILGALNLELPESYNYLNAEVVGNNGQLPNLDLFNVVFKLCSRDDARLGVGGLLSTPTINTKPTKIYLDALKMTLKMMSKQAKGFSDINHAVFLQHNVQSLTIQGLKSGRKSKMSDVKTGRVMEGFFRSLNNLLEKLHHSYFFYLITATDRFISIVLYMPPFGLILLAPTLKALGLWLKIKQEEEKSEESSTSEEEDKAIEELLRAGNREEHGEKPSESIWMEVFYILAVAHILGVVLYYSPVFASSWSAMYNLGTEDSLLLIFLSTYSLALLLPFSSFFRFSENPKVLEVLRVVALLFYAMILGCTGVMNFSLAMVTVAVSVPLITPITADAKRLKFAVILMALLASPVVVAVVSSFASQYLFSGSMENLWMSTKDILRNSYEQSLLGNSWNYELACLLLYPNWLLFWFLAVARKKEV